MIKKDRENVNAESSILILEEGGRSNTNECGCHEEMKTMDIKVRYVYRYTCSNVDLVIKIKYSLIDMFQKIIGCDHNFHSLMTFVSYITIMTLFNK